MKRFSILLLCMSICMYVAAGYNDSGVTEKASTEQVSVKIEKSIVKVSVSSEYEEPITLIYDRVAQMTPKPQALPYAEKLACGYGAVNKGPPDFRCQKS